MPRSTIIIPTYNRPEWLLEAVDSVRQQTDPDFEVLVVDDGSSEDVHTPLGPVLEADRRVRYHRQENSGPARARNTGLDLATGRYVTFLDNDDILLPRRLEVQAAFMDAHPDIGVSVCRNRYFYLTNEGGRETIDNPRRLFEGQVLSQLIFGNYIPVCNALVRRELFEGVRYDRTLRNEDWEVWLRFALAGVRFGRIEEVLLEIRLHPRQMSAGDQAIAESRLRILDWLEERLEQGEAPLSGRQRADARATIELRRMAQHVSLRHPGAALRALARGLYRSPRTFLHGLTRKATAFCTKRHQVRARVYGRRLFVR